MSTPQQQRVTKLLSALFDYDQKHISTFSGAVRRANELRYPASLDREMNLSNIRFILDKREPLLAAIPQASEEMLSYMEKDLLSTLQYIGYTTANQSDNPVMFTDPDGRETKPTPSPSPALTVTQRIDKSIAANMGFTSTDSMACDVFVTKVLADAEAKPKGWPNPANAYVRTYREKYSETFGEKASNGWNIVIMISDNPTIDLGEPRGVIPTDPTPHMGLMKKDTDGRLTLVHYTHGHVVTQHFKDEADFKKRMPYEVYVYDTAEFKPVE